MDQWGRCRGLYAIAQHSTIVCAFPSKEEPIYVFYETIETFSCAWIHQGFGWYVRVSLACQFGRQVKIHFAGYQIIKVPRAGGSFVHLRRYTGTIDPKPDQYLLRRSSLTRRLNEFQISASALGSSAGLSATSLPLEAIVPFLMGSTSHDLTI
jgi:hypothetical protein